MSQAGSLFQEGSAVGNSAFLARVSQTITNVTGAGTAYDVVFDDTIFDVNSDFNTGTGVFTAPITGIYQFNSSIYFSGIGAATGFRIRLRTTSRNYIVISNVNPTAAEQSLDISTLADMNAADTAYIEVVASGEGADTIDIFGGTSQQSSFSGFLIKKT